MLVFYRLFHPASSLFFLLVSELCCLQRNAFILCSFLVLSAVVASLWCPSTYRRIWRRIKHNNIANTGARGSLDAWRSIPEASRSWIPVQIRLLNIFNISNKSSNIMAPEFTQRRKEVSARHVNPTTSSSYGTNIWTIWDPRRLTPLGISRFLEE
jgi:hypothetical protein